jgi:kojibiose phosphorylase
MDPWQVTETAFDPQSLHHKETVFTIGNGYLGTRGTFEEGYPGDRASTLLHGVFDDVPVYYSELANIPDWLNLSIRINGQRFRMDQGQLLDYRRELRLSDGTLSRQVCWRSPSGETIEVRIERFASLADQHLLGIRCQVKAIDFTGDVEFRAGIQGQVDNVGFRHWEWIDQGRGDSQTAFLVLRTLGTKITLCMACRLDLPERDVQVDYWDSQWNPVLIAKTRLERGEEVAAEKLVSVYTSRENESPKSAALASLEDAASEGYSSLHMANQAVWERDWEKSNVTIEGDEQADLGLRFSLFQLLIAAPRRDQRVSIAAKSLSGFGYRGHAFWDTEIFILPFFIYTQPEIARNLLMYRYHTLPGARRKASQNGFQGAMYAWESAATGDETTPRWVPLPESPELVRIWPGDIEHHITADVAYGIHQYWQVTGDDDFLRDFGAEILLETARFWDSRVEWDEGKGRYEINNVIGPDEYHDHVDNNAYTNVLARWNLQTALDTLTWLRDRYPEKAEELETRLELAPDDLDHWETVIDKLYLGYDAETRLYEQFKGFFQRKDADLRDYEPRYKSLQVVLGIEGVQDYQILKQPDVLMMLYLLREQVDPETLKANWDYYTPRTDLTYGSSLGPAIQAALAARLGDIQAATQHFLHATRIDLEDIRKNAGDGIHAATAGGLWQAAVFGFGGLEIREEGPTTVPRLPPHWKRLKFRIVYRGKRHDFDFKKDSAGVEADLTAGLPNPTSERGPRFPILGAIFDLDGVLTDTSEFHFLGWQRLADEEGFPFDRQANEALRGVSRQESLKRLLKGKEVEEDRLAEMMERKNRYYEDQIVNLTPNDLLPGAREFLEELRVNGIKIAVGSASKNARTVIEKLEIASLFDAISDGNSVERQKPAPDLFLHAASQLGLPAEKCVVFEDAEAGVSAALAGGMWVVGIGPVERVGAAHLVLAELQGLTWESLQELLMSASQARVARRSTNTNMQRNIPERG